MAAPSSPTLGWWREPKRLFRLSEPKAICRLRALENLKPIEKELFATRILSDDPASLKDIGKNYNITREAVRQAEQRLLKKFKMYLSEAMPEAADYFKN